MLSMVLAFMVALPVGEKLSYRVKVGPLSAGSMALEVVGIAEVGGDSCYHLVSHLVSNPAYASLFTLNDTVESYARVTDFVTRYNRKHVQESKYENLTEAGFDYENWIVTYSDESSMELEAESRDMLSLWYYCRSVELAVGDCFQVYSHIDRKNYWVTVRVTGRETVRTRVGTYSCLVVDIASTGLAASGRVYLTDDDARLPVIIRTRMPVGYLVATLVAIDEGD